MKFRALVFIVAGIAFLSVSCEKDEIIEPESKKKSRDYTVRTKLGEGTP